MQIKFVRKIKGNDLIAEFQTKYGSLDKLARHVKKNPNDVSALIDYEDWCHLLKNPEEEIVEELARAKPVE